MEQNEAKVYFTPLWNGSLKYTFENSHEKRAKMKIESNMQKEVVAHDKTLQEWQLEGLISIKYS